MKINNSFWILVFLAACNAPEKKEDKPALPSFTSKEIGWTISIPTGFKSISENRIKEREQKGKAAVEEATNQQVETSTVIHLLNFQKNQFNSLNATLQPYDENISGSYVKSNELTKKAVYDAYTSQKIRVDTSSFEPTVAGLPFKGFTIKIYGPNGDVIMTQLMFNQLRKGYDFGVYINSNNAADQKVLLDALNHSKFSN